MQTTSVLLFCWLQLSTYLTAQANGMRYFPNLLQNCLLDLSIFCADWGKNNILFRTSPYKLTMENTSKHLPTLSYTEAQCNSASLATDAPLKDPNDSLRVQITA